MRRQAYLTVPPMIVQHLSKVEPPPGPYMHIPIARFISENVGFCNGRGGEAQGMHREEDWGGYGGSQCFEARQVSPFDPTSPILGYNVLRFARFI